MRGAEPSKGEPISGPYPRGRICSLHVGEARGATTWDEQENVCWLLAFHRYHRNGDPKDAYAIFNGLYESDDLMPTAEDYVFFFEEDEDEDDFLDRLRLAGARLLAEARANPGSEAFETWEGGGHQVMCIDLVIEEDGRAEEGWMGLTLPKDEFLSDEDVYDMVAALLPDDVNPIWSDCFGERERRPGEVVYRWEYYGGAAAI